MSNGQESPPPSVTPAAVEVSPGAADVRAALEVQELRLKNRDLRLKFWVTLVMLVVAVIGLFAEGWLFKIRLESANLAVAKADAERERQQRATDDAEARQANAEFALNTAEHARQVAIAEATALKGTLAESQERATQMEASTDALQRELQQVETALAESRQRWSEAEANLKVVNERLTTAERRETQLAGKIERSAEGLRRLYHMTLGIDRIEEMPGGLPDLKAAIKDMLQILVDLEGVTLEAGVRVDEQGHFPGAQGRRESHLFPVYFESVPPGARFEVSPLLERTRVILRGATPHSSPMDAGAYVVTFLLADSRVDRTFYVGQ